MSEPGASMLAAVAAGRDDGHALGVGRVGGAIDVGDGVVVEEPDQLVLELGETLGAAASVAVALPVAGAPCRAPL